MITDLFAAWLHFRIRLAWTLRSPSAAVVLLAASSLALLHVSDPGALIGALESELQWFTVVVWVMWLYLWPALPAIAATGRATGGHGTALRLRALPSLPIGPRLRVIAESAVVLSYVAGVRAAARWMFPEMGLTAGSSAAADLALLVPTIVAWIAPAPSINIYMLRPLFLAVLLAAALQIGSMSTTWGLALTVLGLTGLCLATIGREWRSPLIHRRIPRAEERVRPGIDPALRLRSDAWRLPAATWGPGALSLLLMVVVFLTLDAHGYLPRYALSLLWGLSIGTIIVLALRPFDSNLIGMGLSGKQGARIGDFMRAWSVLPVRPEPVLRMVYLHGLVVAGGLWLGVVVTVMVRTWVLFGRPGLSTAVGGSLSVILVPFAAAVPCLAGLLVAAAVGDRTRSIISGACFLLAFYGHFLLLVSLDTAFGNDSILPTLIDGGFLIALGLIGGVPPLVHLRPGRARWTEP